MTASSSPPRVLVADADTDTRSLYRLSFTDAGCDVIEAADGRDALVTALVRAPALLVTELRLPFIDGAALCGILRRDRQTANVPILVVTSEMRPTELDRVRRIGANAVLVKPATPDIILSTALHLWRSDTPRTRSDLARAREDDVSDRPDATVARSAARAQQSLTNAHRPGLTITPPDMPPGLHCPSCGRVLTYRSSYVGGANARHREQWDYLTCPACGAFQYRQRTRKLRRIGVDEAQWIETMMRRTGDE